MELPGSEELQAKCVQAGLDADPAAFLLADHEWMRFLLSHYRALVDKAERQAEVREAIEALKPLLDLHIRREEEVFFPAVDPHVRALGRGSTEDMYGEHDAIRIRIDELIGALSGYSPVPAYGAFSRALLNHFDNEEELVFEEAPQRLTAEVRAEVIEGFKRLEDASSA